MANVTHSALSGANLHAPNFAVTVGTVTLGATDAGAGYGVMLSNSNNVSFGMSASTVTASVNPGVSALSAGTATVGAGQVVLSNSNGVSFGISGSTITGSVAAQPSFSAGTTLATSGTVVFSNSNNVTFGMSGQTITASIPNGALAATLSMFEWPPGVQIDTGNGPGIGALNSSMLFSPFVVGQMVTATQAKAAYSMSVQSSNANTMQGTLSQYMGIYTMNASTLSLATSGSQSYSWSNSSQEGSTVWNGVRQLTVPMNVSMVPGNYWLGMLLLTSNGGTSQGTLGMTGLVPRGVTAFSGLFGVATASSVRLLDGFGGYSATQSNIVASAAVTDINGSRLINQWFALRATS